MSSLTSQLFRLARLSATAGALSSGRPDRIVRRASNIVIGRALARAGFWKAVWK
jgi:hypothetical protein